MTSNVIQIDRVLSELDNFAIDFSSLIGKHTSYVIVSGYVSILLGRSRTSEDIDMIIPVLDKISWTIIYNDLIKHNYYCLNSESADESYSYLKDNIAVRFAPLGKVIPNMEVAFASSNTQKLALSTKIKAIVGKKILYISNLELQIAYKEKILKSPKDMEDARHLRLMLGKGIDSKKFKEYQGMLK